MKTQNLRIISGGQTGVDRAALDAALEHGIPCGGLCPKGRKAEDGPIDLRYPLEEHSSSDYRARTRQNVLDAHGTIIFYHQHLRGGTKLTESFCIKAQRPHLLIDCHTWPIESCASEIKSFVENHFISVLNIAGPRASSWREGHAEVSKRLRLFFELLS